MDRSCKATVQQRYNTKTKINLTQHWRKKNEHGILFSNDSEWQSGASGSKMGNVRAKEEAVQGKREQVGVAWGGGLFFIHRGGPFFIHEVSEAQTNRSCIGRWAFFHSPRGGYFSYTSRRKRERRAQAHCSGGPDTQTRAATVMGLIVARFGRTSAD